MSQNWVSKDQKKSCKLLTSLKIIVSRQTLFYITKVTILKKILSRMVKILIQDIIITAKNSNLF